MNKIKKMAFLSFTFLFFANISIYADCIKGDCKNGKGVFVLRKGDKANFILSKYDGAWKNGKFHGKGKLLRFSYADGKPLYTHLGEFRNGKADGKGKRIAYSNNKKSDQCEGLFKNDLEEGQVKCIYYSKKDGRILNISIAKHNSGRLNGQGMMTHYWPNGKIRQIDKGVFGGKWIFKGTSTKFDKTGKQIKVEKVAHKKGK